MPDFGFAFADPIAQVRSSEGSADWNTSFGAAWSTNSLFHVWENGFLFFFEGCSFFVLLFSLFFFFFLFFFGGAAFFFSRGRAGPPFFQKGCSLRCSFSIVKLSKHCKCHGFVHVAVLASGRSLFFVFSSFFFFFWGKAGARAGP